MSTDSAAAIAEGYATYTALSPVCEADAPATHALSGLLTTA